jgi:hypothetical protein
MTRGTQVKYGMLFLIAATASAAEFHGLRPTDPGGRCGLRNPERGLRIETYVALPEGGHVFSPAEKAAHLRNRLADGYAPQNWRLDVERYAADGVTVGQFYIYLTDYAGGALDEAVLGRIQAEFDAMRRTGIKALLRFAYETTTKAPAANTGPTREMVLRHMDQLQPLVEKNSDVIYVLQAGFIGAWGEWHSAVHIRTDEDRAAILGRLLRLAPRDRCLQVRCVPYKTRLIPLFAGRAYQPLDAARALGDSPEARIGFHNDGVLAGPSHGGSFGRGEAGDPSFDLMTRESFWVPVDGELFWADQGWNGTETPGNVLCGGDVAQYFRLHHFTTFSLAHSYSEHEGKAFSMDRWRSEPVTKAGLEAAKLPVSDGWFEDAFGAPVARVWFDYLRDHLGYRLEAREAKWPRPLAANAPWTFELVLVNRGFAAPVNPRPAMLLFIPRRGTPIEVPLAADPRTWQPFEPGDREFKAVRHTVSFRGALPAMPPGDYSIALWLPDAAPALRLNPHYAIRLANRDTTWWTDEAGRYGANILGLVSTR